VAAIPVIYPKFNPRLSYRANGEPVVRQRGIEILTASFGGDSRIDNGDIETPLRQYN
jgi:hypothetical protein